MRYFLLFVFLGCFTLQAQQRIDSSFAFQSDPAKKYSIYLPSLYNTPAPPIGVEFNLMVGFHPLNPGVWDAETWCDTLVSFAEEHDLILICPDGGIDGMVDDAIDTAFTTALIDSAIHWYQIDTRKIYAMGFSWGGRATYTYGLNHVNRFGGFIPIGAAINGTNEVSGVIQNASGKPYYIVHGANDAPSQRFTPIRDALINNGALVNSILMPGVGHTIAFPNRNAILGEAYEWIDSVNCAKFVGVETTEIAGWEMNPMPNPMVTGSPIQMKITAPQQQAVTFRIYDLNGKQFHQEKLALSEGEATYQLNSQNLAAGQYFIIAETNLGRLSCSLTIVR